MIKNRSFLRTMVQTLVISTGLMLLGGCDQDIELDPDWSVNLFKPGPKWPNVKKLTVPQKEIYQKYGKPDCFHVFWTPDGALKRRIDLEKMFDKQKPKTVPAHSWVYSHLNKEVLFQGSSYTERPIPQTLKIIVENGDPEDVQILYDGIIQWQFFSTGKLYKIKNDRVIDLKEFTPMGKFVK
jgi:hypothetical protein